MSTPERTQRRPSEAVAGLLAACALAISAVAVVDRPARLAPAAMLVSLIAAGMGGRHQRLAAFALAAAAASFVVGMTIAVLANKPIV